MVLSQPDFIYSSTLQGKTKIYTVNVALGDDTCIIFLAYLFTNCALVLRPLHELPRHFGQKRSSSIFSSEGIFPAKAAPGISSSVN